MSEKDVIKALKEHIRRQDKLMKEAGKDGFKLRDPIKGKEMLTARQILLRIEKDKKFTKILVMMVNRQSIEHLMQPAVSE